MHEQAHTLPIGFLRTDGFVRLYLFLFAGIAILYALPLFTPEQMEYTVSYAAEAVIMGVVLAAVLYRVWRIPTAAERRFWILIAAAQLPYLMTFTFYTDWEGSRGIALGLLEDSLHLLFYAFLFLAIVCNPHLLGRGSAGSSRRRIESVGSIVFFFGLIVYLVVLPGAVGTDSAESYAPQSVVYCLLDVAALLAFLYMRRICESPRWRAISASWPWAPESGRYWTSWRH